MFPKLLNVFDMIVVRVRVFAFVVTGELLLVRLPVKVQGPVKLTGPVPLLVMVTPLRVAHSGQPRRRD